MIFGGICLLILILSLILDIDFGITSLIVWPIVLLFWFFRSISNTPDTTTAPTIKFRQCEACGSRYNLQIHHIRPVSLGGNDSSENLRILCKSCHEKIHGYSFSDTSGFEHREYGNRSSKLVKIDEAIENNLILTIKYITTDFYTQETRTTTRDILPIEVYSENNRLYVKAYCFLRKEERNFRISKIKTIKQK